MKVSIIIPTHNRAKLLKRALESTLNQTYKNIEVIVVSDGSTDNTDIVMDEYKRDSRVNFISYHPAKGGNYARNTGIKNAKGEFIAFLDDDDEWMPDKLELQIKEFNQNANVGLVYTGVEIIYNFNKRNIKYYSLPKKTGNLSKEILVANCIGTTSSVMVRKNLITECGMFDEKLKARQDYDLWIRVCQKTLVGVVNKPLVRYYNYTTNKQISDDIKKYESAIEYIDNKYVDLYSKVSEEIRRKHRHSMTMLIVNKALRNQSPKVARAYLKNSFLKRPTLTAIIMYMLSFLKYETILKIRTIRS
ncbi:glycosyltransferase family A protein [Halalkalibacterium halodurans]|uniref:Glycosyltransferase n=1 Tax=Halalkalibacterium halodurans (strain ATCC BAA-125 / DSM 18197 / FERM 7344 / JCM 9153 / C-125) TaxID=272558 RepID=Q9K6L6_HALH5|nr:glycosyltransferase family A protein [Halalkalibacterium halodurans]MED4170866.1 glycosyltransferase family A protein [Halalkalibacterium halodurans]BAB07432.1 glycosyltransferase [Halalkalibacterium halodurans C-125]